MVDEQAMARLTTGASAEKKNSTAATRMMINETLKMAGVVPVPAEVEVEGGVEVEVEVAPRLL
jgi:hypothetical protein